ncbi:hypothetical protein AAF712_012842 [Marasmius tenuissimus]|uniref:Uncharacterized protein n=1 Tax=Marasmius tenuissimus TaxID=585030 RepID=A0ABR2ZHG1_9AGAR
MDSHRGRTSRWVQPSCRVGGVLTAWFSNGEVTAQLLISSLGSDLFFPLFTASELKQMSIVNHSFWSAISDYQRRIYRIGRFLQRFFTLPQILRFREVQVEEGYLISGSVALQFFANVEWPDSDLDLYCYPGHFRRLVKLIGLFGYRYVPPAGGASTLAWALKEVHRKLHLAGPYGVLKAIVYVFSFQKQYLGKKTKIQIMVCRNSPMEVILSFHSCAWHLHSLVPTRYSTLVITAVVMNFIGASFAVSLYPYSTLHMSENIQFIPTSRAAAPLRKYQDRGWITVASSSPGSGLYHASELARDRSAADSAAWVIPLDGTSMTPDSTAPEYRWIKAHSWSHVFHSKPRRINILLLTGIRCGWKWKLTYALAAKHLIMHGKRREMLCEPCKEHCLQQCVILFLGCHASY